MTKNFVVVSAAPSGTQDPRQALELVSDKGTHTFHDIVRDCVALSVFNCRSRRPHYCDSTW